jgi:hypothetical protein
MNETSASASTNLAAPPPKRKRSLPGKPGLFEIMITTIYRINFIIIQIGFPFLFDGFS